MTTIVGIDPGASGGIAIYKNGHATGIKMPVGTQDINTYLSYIRESNDDVIVFLEKVNSYRSDKDDPGKNFGIEKLLANYQELKTLLSTNNLPYCTVPPITWQTTLGLYMKDTIKSVRKQHYKKHSQKKYPEIKVTLALADALCLVSFATLKMLDDPYWIEDRIIKPKKRALFK